jgi:subtilisin family serine protease
MRRTSLGFWRLTAAVAAAATIGLVPVGAGAAPTAQVTSSRAVERASGELLVRFRSGTTADRVVTANRVAGAATEKTFTIVSGLQLVRVAGGAGAVAAATSAYRANADVVYVTPNRVWSIDEIAGTVATPNDPLFASEWGLNNTGQTGGTKDADIDAPAAWNATTGDRNVVVTLIDTGVQLNHPDLVANLWSNTAECAGTAGVDDDVDGYVDDCHGIDTINGDSNPSDDFGHGTHTAGTIGAVGNNGVGVTGVNWAVSIMPCKSHDSAGFATAASVIECLQYADMLKHRGVGIVATSNSYGGCTEACSFDPALYDAIHTHLDDGILFVVSAGNDSSNNDQTPVYPSSYYLPNVISVEATTDDDVRASFSSYGPRTVHVGAPGQSVLSTYFNSGYATLSGTSMAAPHVAGVAALLKAQTPARDWRAIRNLILSSADPVAALANTTVTGARVNAAEATHCTDSPFFGVLQPLATTVGGQAATIAVLDVNCAAAAGGKLRVNVTPGGPRLKLRDNGMDADLARADGIYSSAWTPAAVTHDTTLTLKFSNGSTASVVVTP